MHCKRKLPITFQENGMPGTFYVSKKRKQNRVTDACLALKKQLDYQKLYRKLGHLEHFV